jgi:4-amino-4-deoxychorismate lyase
VIVVNGRIQDSIPVTDRGLQYGDGLFETIALRDGSPRHFDRHLRRLALGCDRLSIPFPGVECLMEDFSRLTIPAVAAVLKIIVTRGSGGRGYRPPESVRPTRILSISEWPDYPAANTHAGVVVRMCAARLARNPALAGLKHLNRLEQVMARREWHDPAVSEGLMLDTSGLIIEGTSSNLFVLYGRTVATPDLSYSGVSGITRERVMEVCRQAEIPLVVRDLSLEDLRNADELFLTNSIFGVWPVREIQGLRVFPGWPMVAKIQRLLGEAGAI